MKYAPLDQSITIQDLITDPYPIYARVRKDAPVLRVKSVGRTFLTKAKDTKFVKDTPEIFSSDDPNTPMQRAFLAHTLMRKDGAAHARERGAMQPAYAPSNIRDVWAPIYEVVAKDYVGRLPKGEVVDLFERLAGPFSARCLTHLLGITQASDSDMIRWSQTLINGAGNFGWRGDLFELSDTANAQMDACFEQAIVMHRTDPGPSALSVMVNADEPIEMSQVFSNIKIAIGGGINEPRDAFLTLLFGLLSDPDQRAHVQSNALWGDAFDEAIRWVAPIQVSSRLVKEGVELNGCWVPKGDTVMTIQASANHDEDFWERPEVFDVTRPKNPHQAFGNGPHFCQGKHIARKMLVDILLPILFDRFPKLELAAPESVRFRGFGFRGPTSLPVLLN